ncbi:MAG TPA: hypothetical protein VFZ65_13565 [Planctomycetota bacterium]|nr:hypothetical protein [Planctomycetota bacterium]
MRCATVVLLLPALALAQQSPRDDEATLRRLRAELRAARDELDRLGAIEVPEPTQVRGSLGVDFTNQYFFRGILQEDQGAIAQPWLELDFGLGKGVGLLHDVEWSLGIWNSLHDGPTGGAGSVWYESDVYSGLSVGVGERLRVGVQYTGYHSPNASFGTVQEIAVNAAFDDARLWLGGGLQPSVTLAFEVAGQADAGNGLGIFAGVGIAPGLPLGSIGDVALSLTAPVHLGLSVHDYFEAPGGGADDTFGYLDTALVASAAMGRLSTPMRSWQVDLGLHWLLLGDSNQQRNGGSGGELLVAFGVSSRF